MPFVPTYDYTATRKRTSDSYAKFSPDYRSVYRMVDDHPTLVWKHWIGEANAGRGMMANCPNTSPSTKICPIEKQLVGLAKDDPTVIQRRAKKRYIINVVDRTPYGACASCSAQTPKGKNCTACGAKLPASIDYAPLNRLRLLEGGPQLFETTLNAVENMQLEDYPDSDITGYDIVFTTTGTGRDRKIAAIPQAPSELDIDSLPEVDGEAQKTFDLELLSEPASIEEIEAMVEGATVEELNAIRGIG